MENKVGKRELEKRSKRAKLMTAKLVEIFPNSKIALNFSNNLELLIAVILSAQCTDKKVNEVTEKLFFKYPNLDDYVNAKQSEFEKDIHSTGFYRNKTKNVLAAAKMIKDEFNGEVPSNMQDLLKLPGVARKTANIVLGDGFGKVEGIAVDTHVKRLSILHGLTTEKNPDKIEQDLMAVVPEKEWLNFNHRLIEYGRQFCPARKHEHDKCPLTKDIEKIK